MIAVVHEHDGMRMRETNRLSLLNGRIVPEKRDATSAFLLSTSVLSGKRWLTAEDGEAFLRALPTAYSGTRLRVELIEEQKETKGDVEGHPFRGNQWSGGGVEVFATPGRHTVGDAKKLVAYLEKQTEMRFHVHGSIGRGSESVNDVDIAVVDPSEEELQKLSDETNEAEAGTWDRVTRGEITQEQALEELIGDPNAPDSLEKAFSDLGFEHVRTMKWAGIHVDRYERPSTRHAVEVWRKGDDDEWGVSGKSKKEGALILMVVGKKKET
jgi:hypothetical protein